MKIRSMLLIATGVALCGIARAELITFEDGNHGVSSVDNMTVSNQYAAGAGVTFRTGVFGNTNYAAYTAPAYLEQMGTQAGETAAAVSGNSGFGYISGDSPSGQVLDTLSSFTGIDGFTPAQRTSLMGDWFLRTRSFTRDSLTVSYATGVTQAGFEIWDIDGDGTLTEEWTISVFNGGWASGNLVGQVVTSEYQFNADSTSRDGQAYVVGLDFGGQTFDRFALEFTGTKNGSTVGLAFNNFNTTAIPEPSTMMLLAFGGCAAWLARLKQRS